MCRLLVSCDWCDIYSCFHGTCLFNKYGSFFKLMLCNWFRGKLVSIWIVNFILDCSCNLLDLLVISIYI